MTIMDAYQQGHAQGMLYAWKYHAWPILGALNGALDIYYADDSTQTARLVQAVHRAVLDLEHFQQATHKRMTEARIEGYRAEQLTESVPKV